MKNGIKSVRAEKTERFFGVFSLFYKKREESGGIVVEIF
jgi:hypothetical protein